MIVTPIQTPRVEIGDDLYDLLANHIPPLKERTVVVITSKIISLCQKLVVPLPEGSSAERSAFKHELVKREADWYLDPSASAYNLMLTIKDSILAVNAGIDESNVQDRYVLLPEQPYGVAEQIWRWLRQHYQLKEVGVVITDSTTLPLKWGVIGRALAFCGFEGLKNRIGEKDLYGRELVMTQMNIAEGIASAAVLEMGEGAESTPLCFVQEVTHLTFRDQPLTPVEIESLLIAPADDAYAPVLMQARWQGSSAPKTRSITTKN